MFCKHKWEVLSSETTESNLELSTRCLKGIDEVTLTPKRASPARKHIQIVACEKCGKLKRFVENI